MWSDAQWSFLCVAAQTLAARAPAAESWSAVYARAGYLLSAVERDNRSTIDEIVETARRANDRGKTDEARAVVAAFDVEEFFGLLAIEMIGEPVSWFDGHALFRLGDELQCGDCLHREPHVRARLGGGSERGCPFMVSAGRVCSCLAWATATRPFVVPRIEFGAAK